MGEVLAVPGGIAAQRLPPHVGAGLAAVLIVLDDDRVLAGRQGQVAGVRVGQLLVLPGVDHPRVIHPHAHAVVGAGKEAIRAGLET